MSADNITQILIAIIALVSSVLGALLGYIGRSKKQAVVEAKREQKQSDLFDRLFSEIDGVKLRLDEHNKYSEKFSDINTSIVTISKDIEYIKEKIK